VGRKPSKLVLAKVLLHLLIAKLVVLGLIVINNIAKRLARSTRDIILGKHTN
jgi:hypothetical protein